MSKLNDKTFYKLLNVASKQAGLEDRLGEINKDNIHNLSTLDGEQLNEFIKVIGKIVRQRIYDTTFSREDNPFAKFFREPLEPGLTSEDLYLDLITGSVPNWSGSAEIELGIKKPDITACYHTTNYEKQYKVSTSYAQAKSAFMSMSGVGSLMDRILGTLNSSCEYDTFLACIELISTMYNDNIMYHVYNVDLDTSDGIKKFLYDFKRITKDMTMMTNKYNPYRFTTKTPKDQLVFISKPKFIEKINVDYLAGVFNLSKAEIQEKIIEVPDDYGFGSFDKDNDNIVMIAMDKRAFVAYYNLFEGSSQWVASALATNTFLTTMLTLSYGKFFNTVVFEKGSPIERDVSVATVANGSISVNPAKATVGTEVTVTVSPASRYKLKEGTLKYTNSELGTEVAIDASTNKFVMPDYPVTVTCEFVLA